MSDTPETDAKQHFMYMDAVECVEIDFARKLERERNSLQDQRDFCMGEIERLRKERDEAREKYFAMRDLGNNATELAKKYKQERDTAKANLREAVSLISDRVKCDDFHHEKCDRHIIGEACPIVARFKAAVKRLEEVAYE